MQAVQMFATEPSFDANGVLIPAGHIGTFDKERLTGKEKHLREITGDDMRPAIVEIAAIAPTGPNPRNPQQIPPDAIQGPTGDYVQPGKRLVGEVTAPEKERIEERGLREEGHEAAVTEKLEEVMGTSSTQNDDDELVSGTVAEITADLGTKTDDEIAAMRAAEVDRERPRKGVLSAIDAEVEARKTA